jgi:molecular chaperone GrpE
MTGSNESGQPDVAWDSEADEASGSHGAQGAEGAERGSDYGEESGDDDVVEGEVLNAEDVGEFVGQGVDDDPVAVALNQRDEYLDSLRRLQADFENYKKRVAKQQADQVARAAVSLVDKILPVLDTLDLAIEHLADAESADGRSLVAASSQLRDVLVKEGLERLDPIGEVFDPNSHEAVGHLPAEEPADGETVVDSSGEPVVGQVMRAGYRWRGAVVRPAMVMVRG